jgi:hypothetical protein
MRNVTLNAGMGCHDRAAVLFASDASSVDEVFHDRRKWPRGSCCSPARGTRL